MVRCFLQSDGNIPISTGKRMNELYAMNTTIDVRPPSGATGFAPILLAGRVIPFGPFIDLQNFLRGKPSVKGKFSLHALTKHREEGCF